jgi:ABC-2 type transport system ATP-binding protein
VTTDNSIVVEGLVREFRKGPRAVDGIDLEVAPGEIYGFLGPNGAGKSTTVLVLTTLLPPTGGSARVAGFDVVRQGPQVRRAIGAALQEAALDPMLTGRDHLRLQTMLQGIPRAERGGRTDELLERVGLDFAADRKVGGYSGGMKRRLDLALALVHRPRLIFLDEPTTGLDPQSRMALWEEVARLRREDGVTVFLTTQYLEEADVLADRVGIIDHGRIVAEGTPSALKSEIGRPSVHALPARPDDRPRIGGVLERFGDPLPPVGETEVAVRLAEGVSLADVVRGLDAEGLEIADIELRAPTLDDVFLAKTGRSLEGSDGEAGPGVEGDEAAGDGDEPIRAIVQR